MKNPLIIVVVCLALLVVSMLIMVLWDIKIILQIRRKIGKMFEEAENDKRRTRKGD